MCLCFGCAGSSRLCELSPSCIEPGPLSWRGVDWVWWLLLLGSTRCSGFRSCGSQALEHNSIVVVHEFSCSAARGIFLGRDIPVTELRSPALAGRFLTTEPPEKPRTMYLLPWARFPHNITDSSCLLCCCSRIVLAKF